MTQHSDLEDTVRAYADHLLGLGLAPSTVRMYRALMRRAAQWAEEQEVDLLAPTAEELSKLRDRFVASNSTLRQLRCALQHYWEWNGVTGIPTKALRVPKKPRPQWRGIPQEQAEHLAEVAFGWHPEGTVVLIALYTGLRRAEIAAMRWDKFNHDHSRYTVLGKGGKTETIRIHPTLRRILLPHRSGYKWLFPGERRLHVHPATVWYWVKTVAEEAGIPLSTHQLRHTSINRVWRESRDPKVAQRFARHAHSETTDIYIDGEVDDRVDEALESFDWLRPLRKVEEA